MLRKWFDGHRSERIAEITPGRSNEFAPDKVSIPKYQVRQLTEFIAVNRHVEKSSFVFKVSNYLYLSK